MFVSRQTQFYLRFWDIIYPRNNSLLTRFKKKKHNWAHLYIGFWCVYILFLSAIK